MNKLIFVLIASEMAAMNIVFGFKLKTTLVEFEKKFRWTVESLNYLPGELESLPFSPVKNNSWVWKIILKPLSGDVIMYLKHTDPNSSQHRSDISVSGNVAFKNSTHHLIAREFFPPRLAVPDTEFYLLKAPTFTWVDSAKQNFRRAINDTLMLDFYFKIIAPLTILEHPRRTATNSY